LIHTLEYKLLFIKQLSNYLQLLAWEQTEATERSSWGADR